MVIAALVILLFLLGFGSMIISHAHREIHIVPKRVQMAVGIFIIFFTSVLVLYLSGHLFARTMIYGEKPFDVGAATLQSFFSQDHALEQCLSNLNATLQQQALTAAADKKLKLEEELKDIKKEIKNIKQEVAAPKKIIKTYKIYPKSTYSARRTTAKIVKSSSSPKTITNLVDFDPSKYTPETEPVLITE